MILFRDNIKICPPSYFYFKFSSKLRDNLIDNRNSSRILLENSAGADGIQVLKTGFVYVYSDWMKDMMKIPTYLIFKGSCEVTNTRLCRTKFYLKYIKQFEYFKLNFNIQAGYV